MMAAIRLLHTSDWHLGLELGGHDRLEEQGIFLDWLLAACVSERIDALLVAGDIYDVANPSIAAQAALARFLVEFHRALPAATAVLVAGNHDSGARLEIPSAFASALGRIALVGATRPEDPGSHLVVLTDSDGKPAATCLAVPFPRAAELDCRLGDGESPDEAYSRTVDEFYAELSRLARARHPGLPVVAMGHLALAGSVRSRSERVLIGGLESVESASVARHADYVALGHIHRAQKAGAESCRYSGSPLAMDFDERRHPHQVLVVVLEEPGGAPVVRAVEVPEFVPFLRFPEGEGTWSDLEREVRAFDWDPWRTRSPGLRPLVELRFRPDGTESDLRRRTEELVAGVPIRLVGSPRPLEAEGVRTAKEEGRTVVDLAAGDAPRGIFRAHWESRHGSPPPEEVDSCFREVLDAVRTGREGA
jgi:exonuclease SbcD